jgi:hypothetical protein
MYFVSPTFKHFLIPNIFSWGWGLGTNSSGCNKLTMSEVEETEHNPTSLAAVVHDMGAIQ